MPGTYTLVAFNYSGGGVDGRDWTGPISFRNPTPRVVNEPEPWILTCTDQKGDVKAVREVFVERGETVDVGNTCSQNSKAAKPRG